VDGVGFDTLPAVKFAIFGFYKSLFIESELRRPFVDGQPLLQSIEKESIEKPFSEDEVSKTLLDCCGDKSPDPDGLTMAFLKSNWDTLSGDVKGMFAEFFSSGKFVASLNTTFIGLIPKKVGATNIKDFRPISLVGCIYKLLSKVLAR